MERLCLFIVKIVYFIKVNYPKSGGGYPPLTYENVYSKWKMPRLQRGCASSSLVILTTHTKYLQTKSHSFIGWFFAVRPRSRASVFCEKLTFCENFSQKNFLKKFSNFPKNRLTTAQKCGII